jgi:hypothetical protein
MSFFTKAANVAHKGAVLGLMSVFGYQLWQIGKNTIGTGRIKSSPNQEQQRTYFQELDEKVKEEYKKSNEISDSKARGWYQEDDKSFEQEQRDFKKKLAESTRKGP